ncbi:glycosyltransferase [Lysinimonas soli]|uniref:Glycosyltransferase n=1 Tax=Lysinimonas soli TaxID=1074233 RepID=A0ABW0NTH6_9MICO
MADSIHTARWIGQFVDQPIDFVLFPSTPNRRLHPLIAGWAAGEQNMTVRVVPFAGALSIPLWGLDLIFRDRVRGLLLRRVLRRVSPDYIHALELQHGGYITSRAIDRLSKHPPFIATNWGSDIFWFQQYPSHRRRLAHLLEQAAFYSAECQRDVDLARALGFRGLAFPVFPNTGGFPRQVLARPTSAPSTRHVIAVKGYQGWVGRAIIALKVIERLKDQLKDFRIVIFSANLTTQRFAAGVAKRTGLDISWHSKKSLSHDQMMDIFASARAYVGVSLSDGISTSLLESMVNGAFPLQTNTSCASEWITSGLSGFSIDPDDPDSLAEDLARVVRDDALVDAAAAINAETARTRLDDRIGRSYAFAFYDLSSSSDISSA